MELDGTELHLADIKILQHTNVPFTRTNECHPPIDPDAPVMTVLFRVAQQPIEQSYIVLLRPVYDPAISLPSTAIQYPRLAKFCSDAPAGALHIREMLKLPRQPLCRRSMPCLEKAAMLKLYAVVQIRASHLSLLPTHLLQFLPNELVDALVACRASARP